MNHIKNIGLTASLNVGIKKSKSTFVVRVDSDDWVNKNFLAVLYKALSRNNNIDAIACDYTEVIEKNNLKKIKNCLEEPIGCGIMFRRKHLENIGLYDEKFKYAEEKSLRKKFLKKYNITRFPLSLYNYRKHAKNRSYNKTLVRHYIKKLKNV